MNHTFLYTLDTVPQKRVISTEQPFPCDLVSNMCRDCVVGNRLAVLSSEAERLLSNSGERTVVVHYVSQIKLQRKDLHGKEGAGYTSETLRDCCDSSERVVSTY